MSLSINLRPGSWLKEIYNRLLLPITSRVRHPAVATHEPLPIEEKFLHRGSPVQLTADGMGVLFHRRYWVDVRTATLTAQELMAQLRRDINLFVPQDLATFEKTRGVPDQLVPGDEFNVRITGPWNGPVKTVLVEDLRFAFVTLKGHMEAGEIQFRFMAASPDATAFRFEIASWARSKDALVDLAYEKVGVARAAQTTMWTYFCEKVVERSGGERIGSVQVVTEKIPFEGEVIPVVENGTG